MLLRLVWRWGPVLAQMIAIFLASGMSDVPDLPGGLSGYTGHFIGYAILGALVIRAFAGATWAGVTRGAAVRAVALSGVYGVTDEVHQMFVANRMPDVRDWFADLAGAVLAVMAVLALARLVRGRNAATRGV